MGSGSSVMERSDEEIVSEVLSGNREAFGRLVQRYQHGIVNYLNTMTRNYEDALDLSQEVFVKAFRNLHQYRQQYRFSSWLYRIAHNQAMDFFRKMHPQAVSIDESIQLEDGDIKRELVADDLSPEQSLQRKQQQEAIAHAIDRLPPAYRSLIVLRHLNHLSYDDIATVSDLPLGTVKTRIYRGRERLRALLLTEGDSPDEMFER